MSPVWENYRDKYGYLDIENAFFDVVRRQPRDTKRVRKALDFIDSVLALCPITKPEAAQIVFVQALRIAD